MSEAIVRRGGTICFYHPSLIPLRGTRSPFPNRASPSRDETPNLGGGIDRNNSNSRLFGAEFVLTCEFTIPEIED